MNGNGSNEGTMPGAPDLKQFRTERSLSGALHLVFDMPGRSMNVFSNAAIAGLALGGGAEFALAAHYRVITDQPQSMFGLPESLVGLLPGGGGTQRLPRLIGVEAALPVLLDGARIGGAAAIAAGLADALVA